MRSITFFFFVFVVISGWHCKSQQDSAQSEIQLSDTQKILFLDSLQAAEAITTDTSEQFFEYINRLDMMVQMQEDYDSTVSRTAILEDYKQFLRQDVERFTEEEKAFIKDVFEDAFQQTAKISSSIFLSEICLIKTKGQHYGNFVYYTRDNCIIIPENVLQNPEREEFLETMLHEVFHIYTRYNPEQREALYQLIGFEDIGGLENLQLPEALAERYLLNPDGVDFAEAITLQLSPDSTIQAIPIIISNETELLPSKDAFFDYLDFQLFPVEQLPDGTYQVVTNPNGTSPLQLNTLTDFFRQIRDNTNYIIHPDEILADNFVLVVTQEDRSALSEGGRELLEGVEAVLRE